MVQLLPCLRQSQTEGSSDLSNLTLTDWCLHTSVITHCRKAGRRGGVQSWPPYWFRSDHSRDDEVIVREIYRQFTHQTHIFAEHCIKYMRRYVTNMTCMTPLGENPNLQHQQYQNPRLYMIMK